MAEKLISISDKEQMEMEAILIDRDKDEALRFLAKLVEEIKGSPARACGTNPIK